MTARAATDIRASSDKKTDLPVRRLALPIFLFSGLIPLALAGCKEGYSPNTYASSAAQEESTVQRGMIVGVRQVLISANGTIGAAAGGAAGGVGGAQVPGGVVVTALGAIGGTLVGGIGGTAAAQAVADTKGWEYIVQEDTGDKLVSVTQTSKTALPLGLHVLVIAGAQQARIVPDYTVQIAAAPAAKAPAGQASVGQAPAGQAAVTDAAKTAAAPNGSMTFEIDISPALPAAGAAEALPAAPITVASDPTTAPAPRPAFADPASAVPAASSRSGEAVTAEAANNESSATGKFSTGSAATSAQVTPTASIASPPVNSAATVTP